VSSDVNSSSLRSPTVLTSGTVVQGRWYGRTQMLNQFVRRRARILRAVYRRIAGNPGRYQPDTWWDEYFSGGLSDRQTISTNKNVLVARYHYASIEMILLRHLRLAKFDVRSARVCDVGPGAGHWIDFYLSIGAGSCLAIDISQKVVEYLSGRYENNASVALRHGGIAEVLPTVSEQFDIVNAIGVMFHITNDPDWELALHEIGRVLRPGGLFVAGGHFGWIDGLDVQLDPEGVTKRLRSAARWKKVLAREGFRRVSVHRNRAYLHIDGTLPENSLLIATKG
jgi:SAM-dependent methyltransferase